MANKNSAHYFWLSLLLGGSLAAHSAHAQEGSAEAGRAKSATCAACHGVDGNSVTPDWPMLAGQHASYIVRQLRAFKNGERTDVTMKPFADTLSEQDMLDVAAYFEAQTPTPKGADPTLVGLGPADLSRRRTGPQHRGLHRLPRTRRRPETRSRRIRASAASTRPTRRSS